jgi:hypothetical protein
VLVKAVHNTDFAFVDNDKHIACSKPACFCCYHYICHHPGAFVRPPCHNKVYLNWKPPETSGSDPDNKVNLQRDVMIRISERIREAIIQNVLNRTRWMRHLDSTSGITPMRDPGDAVPRPPTPTEGSYHAEEDDEEAGVRFSELGVECIEDEDGEDGGVPLPCTAPSNGDLVTESGGFTLCFCKHQMVSILMASTPLCRDD